eukprot:COSAG01_NODE_2700_length_7232_cov_3.028876_8_plen_66_part_00
MVWTRTSAGKAVPALAASPLSRPASHRHRLPAGAIATSIRPLENGDSADAEPAWALDLASTAVFE